MSAKSSPQRNLSTPSAQLYLVGFEPHAAAAIVADLTERRVLTAESLPGLEALASALRRSDQGSVTCFGPELAQDALIAFLESSGESNHRFIVLGAGTALELFAPLVEQDRLFYLAARPPEPAEIVDLMVAAATLLDQQTAHDHQIDLELPHAEILRQIEDIERSRGLEELLESAERAALALVPARRALCRLVDAETSTLWRPSLDERGKPRDSTISGLIGFVAHTGRSVALEQLGADPRYDPEVDGADRGERFLAVALPAGESGTRIEVQAIMSLTRGSLQEPFGNDEIARLQWLARELGPIVRRRRLAFELARSERATALFRREALNHREHGLRTRQEPLRLTPAWIGPVYRILLALFVVGVLALPFAGRDELATGPAIVRLAERIEVRSQTAGVLERLDFGPGILVRRDQELGRLEGAAIQAELDQLSRELELLLVERLRNPLGEQAGSAFAALRERHELASARLESLKVRAPRDGIVSAHLARPGSVVAAGQPVLSLAVDGSGFRPTIEALVPGRFRPLLARGMALRFEIDGYADAKQNLVIAEVGHELISREQATLLVKGAIPALGDDGLVIVRADLPAGFFESDSRKYAYFDGLTGRAEIQVRRKRFISDWLRSLE